MSTPHTLLEINKKRNYELLIVGINLGVLSFYLSLSYLVLWSLHGRRSDNLIYC